MASYHAARAEGDGLYRGLSPSEYKIYRWLGVEHCLNVFFLLCVILAVL